jgi:hypothetical protein
VTDIAARPSADPLQAFLAELGRLNIDDLLMIALPEPDPEERAGLLQRAVDAAHAADRREALAVAPIKARDQLFRAWSRRGIDPTWFGLNWGRSLGRSEDRARLVAAVEDAAVAAIVADLVPEEDVVALREPFEIAASMAGAAPDTNPSSRGSSGRRPIVALAFIAGILTAILTGVYIFAGMLMAAAAFVARRGRSRERRG